MACSLKFDCRERIVHGAAVTRFAQHASMPWCTFLLAGMLLFTSPTLAQNPELNDLSLEDLMFTRVQLVSRKDEPLARASAAVYVLTGDEIRRAGITSIPEALRLVPGFQVARINANLWAVSARGFISRFANKLLVQIDGRTVYTPLYSGVYWEVQDIIPEDVDRIEVIRGPGATLWGANAVNGVVNVVTRKAQDTKGLLISGGGGTEERAFGTMRYGYSWNNHTHLRIFGKALWQDSFTTAGKASANDGWFRRRIGFRLDHETSGKNTFSLHGNVLTGNIQQRFTTTLEAPPYQRIAPDTTRNFNANILGRWIHRPSPTSDVSLQIYYDRTRRAESIFTEVRHTFDVDLQHHFTLAERHEIVWGGGYRVTSDQTQNSYAFAFRPDHSTRYRVNAFVHDDIDLVFDRLKLTLGARFEHNNTTGFEHQPTARLRWTPHAQHTLWAAWSRAVRIPSRAERDATITFLIEHEDLPAGLPAFAALVDNSDLDIEKLVAIESGYRLQIKDNLSLDLSIYRNSYRNLVNVDPGDPTIVTNPIRVHVPIKLKNNRNLNYVGFEGTARWHPQQNWQIRASYGYAQKSPNTYTENDLGAYHQFVLQQYLTLPRGIQITGTVYHTGSLSDTSIKTFETTTIDAHTDLNLKISWAPTDKTEWFIVGHNLLSRQHTEFFPEIVNTTASEVERGFYAGMTWSY